MCDERFAVEGLVSGQNQYESHVPDGFICAGDLGVQYIERLCVPGELCGRFSGHLACEPACIRPRQRVDGVQLCPAAEQGTSGGRKISRGSALHGGLCGAEWNFLRHPVLDGKTASCDANRPFAGGGRSFHPADKRDHAAAVLPFWRRKGADALHADVCRNGRCSGRRCRDG